jgi:integrase
MARETTGSCKARSLADGTRAFDLRFQVGGERESLVLHERPDCTCGCGGGWDEPAARTELGNILARVRVGIWERPQPPTGISEFGSGQEVPLYGAYGEWWLEQKIAGVFGDRPLAENTARHYRNCLRHLTAFFGGYPLDQIDGDLNLSFKAHLLKSARDQRDALDAGADLRDGQGRRLRPLGLPQIAKVLAVHRAILEAALEDRHVDHNSARGRRLRVRVPKPRRTFLEMDELGALLDAAERQDAAMFVKAPEGIGATAAAVADLAGKGLAPAQIAAEIARARSTVTYHLRQLGCEIGRGYIGRRAICEVLGRSGPRVGELVQMRIGQVRLHDPDGARFRVPDAKTETGVRDVEISPVLVEVLIAHVDRLRRLGLATGPDAYLFPNLRGGAMTRKRVGQIVREAAGSASRSLAAKGLPPLPHTTAHTLRRTYISIALIANAWDVKFVMGQVGHADSTMTMDVYAQMEKRHKRSHGLEFDRLVSEARDQVKALPSTGTPAPPPGETTGLRRSPVASSRRP